MSKKRKQFGVVIHKDGELNERGGSAEYTMSAELANHENPQGRKEE